MKKLLFLFLFCLGLLPAQIVYVATKTTALSGSAEIVTVQASNTQAVATRFIGAFIDSSSASCGITIEWKGTPATASTLTVATLPPATSTAISSAYSSSNVGTGTVIYRGTVPSGGGVWVDLSKAFWNTATIANNLTVRTASCTTTVDINIYFQEGGV